MDSRGRFVGRALVVLLGLIGFVGLVGLAACGGGGKPRRPAPPRFEFSHGIELFETTNGLRFALVSDHRTNLATIDVHYDVGAAADPPGLSGLAHLVEHLLFELRAAPGEPTLGEQLDDVALSTNADTSWDETHYTSTVPASELGRALALEGARMAARCDQLDDAVFLRERDVVLAEEAERASPGAALVERLHAIAYGAGHPYARPIGSREVARATRADVCAFVAEHYAPHNAYLVVTGPFAIDDVRALVGRTFGPIPAGVTVMRRPVAPPALAGGTERLTAPVVHPAAVVLFNAPPWGSAGGLRHALGARLLAEQLEQADADNRWIVGSAVTTLGGPRAPVLAAIVEVAEPDRLESAADEVFRRAALLRDETDGDAAAALSSVVLGQLARWDDLLGRGDWIADFLQYADHSWFMLEDLRAAAEGWERHRAEVADSLGPERARIVLIERGATGRGRVVDARARSPHDLTPWRPPVDPAEADRPLTIAAAPPLVPVERYTLGNGLVVVLARDGQSPLVDARLVFPVGTAHQPDDQPLLAIAGAALLGPRLSARRRGAIEVGERVDETSTTFSIHGLAEASDGFVRYLDRHVRAGLYDARVLAEVKRRAGELEREQARDDDAEVAREQRFREHLFGAGHPYAAATRAVGDALAAVDVAALEAWRKDHFRARDATLIVSGRFDRDAVKRDLAATFGAWPAAAPADLPDVPVARPPAGPSWLAVEDRGASQVEVRVGFTAGSDARRDRAARLVLAAMVIDAVRDVREGLGASYGLRGRYLGGAAGAALLIDGTIDDDRAAAAVPRVLAALAALRDDEAARRAAFVRARRRVLGEVQARVAGASMMADVLEAIASGRAAELDRQAAEVAGLTLDELTAVARLDLDPGHLVLELVGRREPTTAAFAALGATPAWLGEGDADGWPEPDEERPGPGPTAGVVPDSPAGPTVTEPAPPPVVRPPAGPRDEPRPAPPAAPDEPGELDDRLAVGDPHSGTGPRARGLYRGGQRISLDEFLRVSGHPDVAARVASRRRVRIGLGTAGFGLLAASVVYGLVTAESCEPLLDDLSAWSACQERESGRKARMLGGIVLGGVVGAVGVSLSSQRPDDDLLRQYADEHNYRRRREGAGRAAGRTLTVAPVLGVDGAGVTIGGRF